MTPDGLGRGSNILECEEAATPAADRGMEVGKRTPVAVRKSAN